MTGDWFPAGLRPPGEPEEGHTPTGAAYRRIALTPSAARDLARGLRERAAAFRRVPLERILAALDQVHAAWSEEGSGALAELANQVEAATGYAGAHLPLRKLFGSMRRPSLERWLEASGIRQVWLDGTLDEAGKLVFGPRLTLVVSSGNIPGAALPSVVQALLLKSPVLVKTSSAEPVLLPAYAAALAEADPEVAQALAVTGWTGGDTRLEAALLPEVDALVAYGSDETLASLRARLPAHARFVGYGHRISFVAWGRECLGRERMPESLHDLALDFCLFDQQGCLSPHAVYVEEGGETSPEEFARMLGEALERMRRQIPRRPLSAAESSAIHQYRASVEMEAFSREGLRLWSSPEGTAWTVVLDPEPDLRPTPGNRTVVVRPLRDLTELPAVVRPLGPALISCGLTVAEKRRPELVRSLGEAGVTRFTIPGQAQLPEDALLHDGVNALAALARWVAVEPH